MKNYSIALLLSILSLTLQAQIVSLSPTGAGAEDSLVLTFDATQGNGELTGESKVYIHHGVVISGPNGTDWNYVIGNWGQDDGVGEMAPVPGETDKWQITMAPSVRDYFGVPANENIFRISCVFRSADGNKKGTIAPGSYGWGTVAANQDIYIDLNSSNYISLNNPTAAYNFLAPGEQLEISATASATANTFKIWLDEGSGYVEYASVTSATSISYMYSPTATSNLGIKITANVNGENLELERSTNVVVTQPSTVAALPAGLQAGINYDDTDDTKATLVIEAPGKDYVFVVGDFTNWEVQDSYQMNVTPDGELFWLEIDNLTAMQPYVFQYWMDEDVKVGDPYADQVADPWNDSFIEASVFPNIPTYDKTEFGTATVLQTGQTPYTWSPSEDSWQRPDVNHLMIYELHIRDFLESHNYQDLIDSLSYLKRLGIDAIELMPVSEFEGNDSWGYNPSFYFAPDKYYGTKDDLKAFIEAAHQEGMAVILDMVLNHAYGQNPMLQMYFNRSTNKPTPDNPWFNENYVGQYQWGYDFNHESDYTKAFMDRVNAYWLEEYHFDGYRFDFTKGFTNYAPGGNIDGFDQSRIDILKRMADKIWEVDSAAYVILEHWGPFNEESQLANYGMKLWRRRSFDYVQPSIGNDAGNFGSMEVQSHVSYFDSHDEPRLAEHVIKEGRSSGIYNIKDQLIAHERVKMAAAFAYLFPGPKMMWQFDELGYDIDINFNGRVGRKPYAWGTNGLGYYEDSLRQYIYDAYVGILDVRNQVSPEKMAAATTSHQINGETRRLSYDTDDIDLVVIGNFGLGDASIDPSFSETGDWFDYFSGDTVDVANVNQSISLKAGEWHIYTSEKISEGKPGVVEVYDNPVTISPFPFTQNDEITITFDASKAWKRNTNGLVGADTVYFHSGVVLVHPDSSRLDNVVGTLMDDGIGQMTNVGGDIWEITLTPANYYGVSNQEEIFKIGMWFRDANNQNVGLGFRNSTIYAKVESDVPFVSIEPAIFNADDEITITFNARKGNQELAGADKIYLHSGVVLAETNTPWVNGWSNVVGNWGMDDGVGEMSPVPDADGLWQISLTPRTYYGLQNGDFPYWITAVFRSADGNTKGTGNPGPFENGVIHTNQDFFIQNQGALSTDDLLDPSARIYPNPTSGYINLSQFPGELYFEVFNINGQRVFETEVDASKEVDVSHLGKGVYIYKLRSKKGFATGKVVVF